MAYSNDYNISASALDHGDKAVMAHNGFLKNSACVQKQEQIGSLRKLRLLKARAARFNPSSKFDPISRQVFDDGWQNLDELPPFKTEVYEENPKSVITRNKSPDISFDRSINPYRGCEHGCIYCFARPCHGYMGLSGGVDFESKIFAKNNTAQLLRTELSSEPYKPKTIVIGTNTDPYQPIEKKRETMRDILKVMEETNHPVAIITKSSLVARDIDLLKPLAEKGLVKVALSITTLDRKLARAMEPRAATPSLRLKTINDLSQAGIPTSVMVAPVIPAMTDHELERILDSASGAGAKEAGFILLRLPAEVSPLFRDWLLQHYPDRYRHVMNVLRSMRGGKDYDAEWGKRMRGKGPYAIQIGRRFELASKRYGLNDRRLKLRTDLFTPPKGAHKQLTLF